jgi:hypothetical protein
MRRSVASSRESFKPIKPAIPVIQFDTKWRNFVHLAFWKAYIALRIIETSTPEQLPEFHMMESLHRIEYLAFSGEINQFAINDMMAFE